MSNLVPDDIQQLLGVGPYRRKESGTRNNEGAVSVRGGDCGSEDDKGGYPYKSRFSQIKYAPLLDADFLISPKCCDIMKKKSFHKFQKENEMHPMIGTMAEESLMRATAWMKNGCNAFSSTGNSTPMAFWKGQDVLKYIVDHDLKIPSVYGEIIPDEEHEQISMLRNFDGRLRCTGVSRTGWSKTAA